MTPTRSDAVPDMYLYDIPIMERHNLCQTLLKQNVWQNLAEHMGYDRSEINDIKCTSYETNDMEAEELLTRWGEQNHTVTELFVLLSRIQQYAAMNTIKNLVDSRYHRLIGKAQLTDSTNLNEKDTPKLTSKQQMITISEKILNAPMMSNDNNVSDRLENNKQSHGDKIDVNERAGAITKIDYEVLRDATNNWSDKNVLGKGGFATVFKGMWLSTAVAIKRIENRGTATTEMSKIQIQQRLNELKHLNSCRHDNILSLYAVSVNGAEPCLVYQLMQGGSLEHRLFNRSSSIQPLTWQQRINIAGGTARGLQFLHTFQERPLIHGDIKPANILLDQNLQPKIGDFGLVREGNVDEIIVSRAYGTKPYLPSEFVLYRKLTTKVDSYSFGIVLFELSTGRRAYDRGAESFLIQTVQSYVKDGKLLELIDKKAAHVDDKELIFKTIIDLGMDCTKYKYEERPDMVKVLKFFEETLNFTS